MVRHHHSSPHTHKRKRTDYVPSRRSRLRRTRLPELDTPFKDLPVLCQPLTDEGMLSIRCEYFRINEKEVFGDGNCQYRALSHQIYETEDDHKLVREIVVEEMKKNSFDYRQFVRIIHGEDLSYDSYLRKMARPTYWGDFNSLQAASTAFGVKVLLLTSFCRYPFHEYVPRTGKYTKEIYLTYCFDEKEAHYNAAENLNAPILINTSNSKVGMLPHVYIDEKKVKEMKYAIKTRISAEVDTLKVIRTIKWHAVYAKLLDIEVLRIVWEVLMDAVQCSGKNQQEYADLALLQVERWGKLLKTFSKGIKLELKVIDMVQDECYEDTRLNGLFLQMVRSLYDQDVLHRDAIIGWFYKGTNPKGRDRFMGALAPFVSHLWYA